jgi:peptidyl-prolyl cis-trans isomerase SurA
MKKYLGVFLFLFISLNAQQIIDKVVAVVDNEIILKSELDFRVAMEAVQKNLDGEDPKLRDAILNQLIEEKLLYAQAELDSVTVKDEQINETLDNQIRYMTQQYGSTEKIEQMYGMPIEKIKRNLREDTKKSLMAQSVQQKKFGELQTSRKEVEEFFEQYKDSLGVVPEKYEVAHIFQNPKTGERIKKKAFDLAQTILDSLKKGADFTELAKKYSDDPGSASQGGDLGFAKRGVFLPEFEAAAYALAPNQISNIVETTFGYHIIQLLERRGESVHARHILIKPKSDDQADLASISFLNDLRDSIVKNVNTFEYYAKKYSDDKESAKYGGVLGTFETSQLEKPVLDQIYKLKEGEIGYPKRMDMDKFTYGYHILKLIKRVPEHRANLEQDFSEVKRLAEYYKKQKQYAQWIKELKDKIFWEIRL